MSTYNTYLNNFSKAWESEKNNDSPLNTLKAMFKLYLFKQLATDTSIKKTEVNKFFIREVFNIKGDIKKSPFKSCIYNKLTCLHYLIEKTNFSTSQKIDVDDVIEKITDKTFKNINNFYDVMKKANATKKQATKKEKTEKTESNEIPQTGTESNKVVNITNNSPETIINSMQLLDELMQTTLNHFESCFIDNPKTSLDKLITFAESINHLLNKQAYQIKKVA